MCVPKEDTWNFAYALPSDSDDIDDIVIVVPDALQIGWCESPPFFCSASETGRDVIQKLWDDEEVLPEHPLEHRMKYAEIIESLSEDPCTIIEV